ncbi:hypothetical protein [Catenuloplanes japonicus]|uniref:hypothetical protein n=1 Tax=Catenuloplanes japonicus TaxID=33876 RepID=UPI00052702F6|nr:hypothetical protein [Catenuloplanes japonicus]
MTVFKHYELACDHPGCFTAYQASVEQVDSLRDTRAGAKAAGWTRAESSEGAKLDRCPAHSEWVPA